MATTERTDQEPRHPIRVVSERTGLSPDVLRAWEKRYSAVVPPRRHGAGQRLYSDADVERLRLLKKVTAAGRSIGQVAELTTGELAALAREDEDARSAAATDAPAARAEHVGARAYVERAMAAIRALDAGALEAALMRGLVALGLESFLDDLCVPLLRQVGEEWESAGLGIAHEHAASVVLRRVLGFATDAAEVAEGAPVVIVGTPAKQVHELGALLAAASASAVGWRVVFVGADLPASALARAALQKAAHAVALSIVIPDELDGHGPLAAEIRELRRHLPPAVPIVVGGAGAPELGVVLDEAGVELIATLPGFRRHLAALARTVGNGASAP